MGGMGASHGTFAFEPAAAIVFEPRARQIPGPTLLSKGGSSAGGRALLRLANVPPLVETKGKGREKEKARLAKSTSGAAETGQEKRVREYAEFCRDLKVVLGDGEGWNAFMNCEWDSSLWG